MEADGARWCWVCLHPIDTSDRDVVIAFQTIDRVQREIAMHGRCHSTRVGRALKLEPDLLYAPSLGRPASTSPRR